MGKVFKANSLLFSQFPIDANFFNDSAVALLMSSDFDESSARSPVLVHAVPRIKNRGYSP
jgi:hypothetical protein